MDSVHIPCALPLFAPNLTRTNDVLQVFYNKPHSGMLLAKPCLGYKNKPQYLPGLGRLYCTKLYTKHIIAKHSVPKNY